MASTTRQEIRGTAGCEGNRVMRVGYARVSTTEQSIDSQLERLSDCDKLFSEKYSGKKQDRAQLAACLDFVRDGDVLVTTRLDRLARSVSHLCQITELLERKRVELCVLDQAIDTGTPAGRFLFHILGAVAELELTIRKEQQRVGIARSRAAGKRTGRLPALTPDEIVTIQIAFDQFSEPVADIARHYKVSRATVYRALKVPPFEKTLADKALNVS
jgi:DNA invertase Pin-like site-specific DNA recombinase